MPNPYGAPELSATETKEKMDNDDIWLLDIREESEFFRARISHTRVIELPMSRLAQEGAQLLPEPLSNPSTPVAVMCHHGVRSAQVTVWLANQGWQQVVSMEGGIAAYAQDVDPQVGSY